MVKLVMGRQEVGRGGGGALGEDTALPLGGEGRICL